MPYPLQKLIYRSPSRPGGQRREEAYSLEGAKPSGKGRGSRFRGRQRKISTLGKGLGTGISCLKILYRELGHCLYGHFL